MKTPIVPKASFGFSLESPIECFPTGTVCFFFLRVCIINPQCQLNETHIAGGKDCARKHFQVGELPSIKKRSGRFFFAPHDRLRLRSEKKTYPCSNGIGNYQTFMVIFVLQLQQLRAVCFSNWKRDSSEKLNRNLSLSLKETRNGATTSEK